jgi:tetratricopeptide (TPR) repeat protein
VKLRSLAALLAVALSPALAAAQAQTPRVLVLPFSVEASPSGSGLAGAPYWLGEAAAIAITDELGKLGVSAATRTERVAAFEYLQLPPSSSLTRATMIRVGELMGASHLVVGDVQLTDRMNVRARVVDLVSGRQLPDAQADADHAEFFALSARVARGLASAMGLTTSASPAAPAAPASVEQLHAFEDYVKGLVATAPDAQARFLEAALARAPDDARTLLALWQLRTAQGDHTQALAAATRAAASVATSPGSETERRARFAAAQSLIALKRYDDAVRALESLYSVKAASPVSNALGVAQLRKGGQGVNAAAYYFNRAVDEAPDNRADIAFNLGYTYAIAGDATSAVYWLREAVRRQPGDGAAHLILSNMLVAQSKTVEAQRELDLARLLGAADGVPTAPTDKVPRGLERVVSDLDQPARWEALEAPRERDETAGFYVERGRRLIDEHRDLEAIGELRRAIYVSPYLDTPHLMLGRLHQRAGRLDDAVEEFLLALWCRESADGHAGLATAQLAAGKREAAKASADRALALDPANTEAREVIRLLGGAPGGAC